MYKRGDPWNPYDPASIAFPPSQAEYIARMQERIASIKELMDNPEELAAVRQMALDDAAERERTGETEAEQQLREKREWAAAAERSENFKEEDNEAFKNGDYKTAYVIYTACMCLTHYEPLYPLNRAAAALKLKMYEKAVQDATSALDKGNYKRAKALFRRAQGRCFLGEWEKAEEDYTEALILQPEDRLDGFEELKRLRSLPVDDQNTWISEQGPLTLLDVFEEGEVKRRAEELVGHEIKLLR
ncbi:TPR-like protein [Mycena metata]|uniref:TPR-like protein n=1 Tax=Mycena metata TaxID=1033252 RepID=A0AAD7JD99_9AGAR|nr:TPR-like protein [Mycena metata]